MKKNIFSFTLFMLLLFAIYENTKTFYNHKTVAEEYLKIQFVASLDTNGADFKILCKLTENVKNSCYDMLWNTSLQKLQLVIFFNSFN